MSTQYQKIERALSQRKCTTLELIHLTGSTCPWRRILEMKQRGWPIIEGEIMRGRRSLRCWWIGRGRCEECGEWNPPGRAKRFCCASCRAKNYRRQK